MSNDKTFITNENQENTLSGRFNTLLKNTECFDVLVGYFYSSGFYTIYKSLENVDKIRILIGINTDKDTFKWIKYSETLNIRGSSKEVFEIFNNKIIDEMAYSEDSIDVEEGILKFIEWLQSGKLEIKAYPYEDIHAKVYIMTYKDGIGDDGRVITGSSNFTSAGLNKNLEFNVELKNSADYEFALEKFEELWKKSIDVSEEYVKTIQKDTWLNENITPYELYLKFLYEYLKDKLNLDSTFIDKDIPSDFLNLQYQKDAVVDAKSKLDQYGGVFLSDVVGVGKTYISALLAKQLDGKTLIIAPPILLDENNNGSWTNVFRDFGVKKWRAESWGKLDNLLENGVNDYKNVFIDEAHLFRNSKTQRYAKLSQICRGKRVILVTATPLNNSPKDILSQISLFQKPNKSTLPNPKVRNLKRYFNNLENRLKGIDRVKDKDEYIKIVKENAEDIRENVLQHLMVRRTRSSIEKFYSKDLEEQGLKFLEVNDPEPVFYEFDNKLDKIFNETLELVTKELKYTRYTPLLYLKNEDPEVRAPQNNMRSFMRILLTKRLESSFHAFKQSISRFIYSYDQFQKACTKGYVYFSKKDMNKMFEYLENDNEEALEKLISQNKADRKSIDLFDTESLFDDLDHDIGILKKIDYMWKDIDNDPKLDKFVKILSNDEKLQNKVIVFTESKETAEYLTNRLNSLLFDDKVFYFSGDSNQSLRRIIRENFDGKSSIQKDDYNILVTTDVLSEGVNLHRSNVVVNYDIPWNPTKMMQRVGRIQRVGSKFNEVFIYNFFPTASINDVIGLKESAESKIKAFIEMLGNDSKLLTDEEIKAHDLFEKLNSKTTIMGEEEEDTELQYLFQLRNIRDNDKELFERIKRIPKKARTAKKSTINGLLTFVRKGKLKKIYFNNGENISELDLFKTANLLYCKEDTPSIKLNKDYYVLLEPIKREFQRLFEQEDNNDSLKGNSTEGKLLNIVDSLDKSKFTDKNEQFVKDLQKSISEGSIPSQICKEAINALNETESLDSLILLDILRNKIPNEFIYYCSVINDSIDTSGQKEVILSEYLEKGD